jgi:hypothetical protein
VWCKQPVASVAAPVAAPGADLVPNSAVRVVFDRAATEPGCLSLQKGDVATLLQVKELGWCVLRTSGGQKGYYPLAYIAAADVVSASDCVSAADASDSVSPSSAAAAHTDVQPIGFGYA